ncbi:methyltransferase [Streptomyces erythrochromogenes]|uniref:class I SAM-dependent methyltransferase n=1 Tax=Streptomyces erythrochromogenes TaxID=285574 RepID=UPI00341A2B63
MNDLNVRARPVSGRRRAENRIFLGEAVRDFARTGAVAPSGRRLAGTLAAPLTGHTGRPLTVLEAGAGTGAVTRELIPLLPRGSHLDVVEDNPRFIPSLLRLVEAGRRLNTAENTRVHQARVEKLETGLRYDVIVSSLPFNNFTPAQVEAVMDRYVQLLRPGGTLAYFSYLGTCRARSLLLQRTAVRRQRAVERVLAAYHEHHHVTSHTVWANLPPARVWTLRTPTLWKQVAPFGAGAGAGAGTGAFTVAEPRHLP